MFKVSVYTKAGNESLRRFLSRGIEATFHTDCAEHLRHGPAPRQVQSQEVQDSREVLRAVGLPADDVALARARPRHRDQGDVHVRRQGPGRQDILRRVPGGSTLDLSTTLFANFHSSWHGEIIYGGTRWIEDEDTFSEYIFLFPACLMISHWLTKNAELNSVF